MIFKLKNINFTAIKVLTFLENGAIENLIVSNKISFGEKNYKCFVGYLYDGCKIKPLHVMLQKRASMMITYWKNMILFRIKSAKTLKKNLTTNLSTIKSYGDEVTEFSIVDSNHTCLAVISWISPLKKYESYYPQVSLKE